MDIFLFIHSSLSHLSEISSKAYGWFLITILSILNFFQPEWLCFAVMGITILGDFIWGTTASIKLKKFILSKALRETIKKIGIYGFALASVFMIEKIIHDSNFIGIKITTILGAACELWSMSANMLIVKPDMPFLRIFRLQLKGEIESKVGKNLDDILIDNKKSN